MTVIRIKICGQTGPYGRVPQNRFWFVPNCEQGIVSVEKLTVLSYLLWRIEQVFVSQKLYIQHKLRQIEALRSKTVYISLQQHSPLYVVDSIH